MSFFVETMGTLLGVMGKHEEAEPLFRAALEGKMAALGPTHVETLASMDDLGMSLHVIGKYEEAETLFRGALEGREETLGPTHTGTLESVNNLAGLMNAIGKHEEAEVLYRCALIRRAATLGSIHPDTLQSINFGCLIRFNGEAARGGKVVHASVGRKRNIFRAYASTHLVLY